MKVWKKNLSLALTQLAEYPLEKEIVFILPEASCLNLIVSTQEDPQLDEKQKKSNCLLVGPTGSGKSTLIRQLLREFNVTSGDITIDGGNNWIFKETEFFEAVEAFKVEIPTYITSIGKFCLKCYNV